MPFLPVLLAFIGLGVTAGHDHGHALDHWIHGMILLPIVLMVIASFPKGFLVHKNSLPSILGILGLGLLVLALVVSHEYEIAFNIFGGLTLIIAHQSNRRLVNRLGTA
jgi:peptidoglycan/LPS O-acetylase OafA/YrhL